MSGWPKSVAANPDAIKYLQEHAIGWTYDKTINSQENYKNLLELAPDFGDMVKAPLQIKNWLVEISAALKSGSKAKNPEKVPDPYSGYGDVAESVNDATVFSEDKSPFYQEMRDRLEAESRRIDQILSGKAPLNDPMEF